VAGGGFDEPGPNGERQGRRPVVPERRHPRRRQRAGIGGPSAHLPTAYDEDSSGFPGTLDDFRHDNSAPDRYYPSSDFWAQLGPANGLGESFLHDYAVFFPRVHVLPNGKLLIVQPLYTTPANGSIGPTGQFAGKSLVYDTDAQAIAASFAGPQNIDPGYLISNTLAQFTTSVLLPLTPQNN